jgi:hypothetical protein
MPRRIILLKGNLLKIRDVNNRAPLVNYNFLLTHFKISFNSNSTELPVSKLRCKFNLLVQILYIFIN